MRGMPPGRSARPWLLHRLEVAARGIDVLEQKVQALVGEQRRLRTHAERTRDAWAQASRTAERWVLRTRAIGGAQQLELVSAQLVRGADARITWPTIMGVTYPAQVRLDAPTVDAAGSLARSSALPFAAEAYRRAAAAALDHAAATRALELVERELASTRRRLRGLEHHWVPRLHATLSEVEQRLAENEREDTVRSRWVVERDEGSRR